MTSPTNKRKAQGRVEAYEYQINLGLTHISEARRVFREEFTREWWNKGYSMREVAKLLGVSASFLSDISLGKRNPSVKLFSKLELLPKKRKPVTKKI